MSARYECMRGGKLSRRARRNSFGTIIATGTTTNPAFVIRWWEGSRRKKKSGFRTRTEAAETLARIRTGLGDGTLVEKRRAADRVRRSDPTAARTALSAEPSQPRRQRGALSRPRGAILRRCTADRYHGHAYLEFRARLQSPPALPSGPSISSWRSFARCSGSLSQTATFPPRRRTGSGAAN